MKERNTPEQQITDREEQAIQRIATLSLIAQGYLFPQQGCILSFQSPYS
jgi:hypothetical protein